jgi:serine/threonine protein kinase
LAITENNKLQAKLADVGLSRKINPDDVLTAGVGSLDYKSPEIRTGNYDFKTDIWC